MWTPTIIMGAIAVVLVVIGYSGGKEQHLTGLRTALSTTLQMLPLLVCSLVVAGMAQALIPKEALSHWIGPGSGMRGIVIGALVGGLTPGGPYVSLPIAAGLLRSGASVGTVVAYVTGWSIWGVSNLPMQVGILGWRLTLIRVASTLVFPPLAGLVGNLLAARLG